MDITYKLPSFEGPLDLLLQLIQRNKLSITDIPIALVLEQYLDTIRLMQSFDMDVAAEFLDMAARLVHIKSSMLLPKHEEAQQLREELAGELIEYQICREMAGKLAGQAVGGDIFVREPEALEPDYTYRLRHAVRELLAAYSAAAGRGRRRLPPPVQVFRSLVARPVVSVTSRIVVILRRLSEADRIPVASLFASAASRSELVATFLALLELARERRVWVSGDGDGATVRLRKHFDLAKAQEYISEFEREHQEGAGVH